jgi:hypothetical protein
LLKWGSNQVTRSPVFGLVALAVAAVAPASASASAASKPEVTVEFTIAEPVIDNALPQPKLQTLAAQHHEYGRTQGLYQADLKVGWRASIRGSDADGETCRWVDGVTVTMTHAAADDLHRPRPASRQLPL